MQNRYYNQTIELLSGRPEGMRVCNIAKNIYNSNCCLFDNPVNYKSLRAALGCFLWVSSKDKNSPFSRVEGRRGVYTLKKSFAVQLELEFGY